VCVGVGGMFAAAGVVIFTNDAQRLRNPKA